MGTAIREGCKLTKSRITTVTVHQVTSVDACQVNASKASTLRLLIASTLPHLQHSSEDTPPCHASLELMDLTTRFVDIK